MSCPPRLYRAAMRVSPGRLWIVDGRPVIYCPECGKVGSRRPIIGPVGNEDTGWLYCPECGAQWHKDDPRWKVQL